MLDAPKLLKSPSASNCQKNLNCVHHPKLQMDIVWLTREYLPKKKSWVQNGRAHIERGYSLFNKIKNPYLRKFFKFLASLKLAVGIILAIGAISAYGTTVESRFDAVTAQKLVYHTWWSYFVYASLIVNLVAVMVDRLPWRRAHIGFILAHVGIITLLAGSLVTRYYGLDGSMRLGIGESSKSVVLPETDLVMWASFDGDVLKPLNGPDYLVDFMVHPPTAKSPYDLSQGEYKILVTDFAPYALRNLSYVPTTEPGAGPALRFLLQNDRVTLTQWIFLPKSEKETFIDLGQAQVVLTSHDIEPGDRNQIVLSSGELGAKTSRPSLSYKVHSAKGKRASLTGKVAAGETIDTGWMGLKFSVLKYIPSAKQKFDYKPIEKPNQMTVPAIKVSFDGEEEWLGLNTVLRFFKPDAAFIISYANRQFDLGFPVALKKFDVGRYQGTMRAASYESHVDVPGKSNIRIAMNEPLKHEGFTFYQASFEQDESGKPSASILSVNQDPGRLWKYLGCILIVSGAIYLFYFKRKRNAGAAKKAQEQL